MSTIEVLNVGEPATQSSNVVLTVPAVVPEAELPKEKKEKKDKEKKKKNKDKKGKKDKKDKGKKDKKNKDKKDKKDKNDKDGKSKKDKQEKDKPEKKDKEAKEAKKAELKKKQKKVGSVLDWSTDTDSFSDREMVADGSAVVAEDALKAEKKAAKHAAKLARREERAVKFNEYLALLRLDSPALARDEEDLALAKNTYSASRTAYKQRRDQYQAQKMTLYLARKHHKLAQKKAEEEAKVAAKAESGEKGAAAAELGAGVPVPAAEEKAAEVAAMQEAGPEDPKKVKDKKEKKDKKKKKDKKDKKNKKKDGSESSDSEGSSSGSEASSSDSSSGSSASSKSSGSDSGSSESGHMSGESDDSDNDDGILSESSESLEFAHNGELLTRDAAVNSKCDRAQFRLEVRSLRVVQHYARHNVKRKQNQLRKHYKSEKQQTGSLIKIDKKHQKVEQKRSERIVALSQLSPRQQAQHHHHHSHQHQDQQHASPLIGTAAPHTIQAAAPAFAVPADIVVVTVPAPVVIDAAEASASSSSTPMNSATGIPTANYQVTTTELGPGPSAPDAAPSDAPAIIQPQ
jgi:hypothetical protein